MATGLIKDEDIALVRERARIDEVVADYVTLKNAGGGSLKGLCPFHDEKSPSFHVSPERGFYHCFGCHESGDAIKFVQRTEGLDFIEAVRENRPLLVFLTSSGCRYCAQMKNQTFQDQAVADYLGESFVAVAVDARRVAWLVKQRHISGFPTTLIISPEAEVLAQLKGFVSPEKLLPRLEQAAPQGRIASRPTKKTS